MKTRFFVLAVLVCAAAAQTKSDFRAKYGNPVSETYRTPNDLIVTAVSDNEGNVCRVRIDPEGTPGLPDSAGRMSDSQLDAVLDEIAPAGERGKYIIGTFLDVICLPDDNCHGTSQKYERVAITRIGSRNSYRYAMLTFYSSGCEHLKEPNHR